jgi:hypothetical protein
MAKFVTDELYREIVRGGCVPFAGAGISTEGGPYSKPTLYETVKYLARYSKKKPAPSFPDLMQYYCDRCDSGRKHRLLRLIIERLEQFCEHSEIHTMTTMVHDAIAQIPQLRVIVTTNWDRFFEERLNVLLPMVDDRDIPFWNDEKRQILKIHGCVTRPFSIIATTDDYAEAIRLRPKKPLYTKLKDLMATKTFVFVGYSMRDPTLQMVYDSILGYLGRFARPAYAIDPDPSDEAVSQWEKRGVTIMRCHALAFFREVRARLVKDEIIAKPSLVAFYTSQRDRIRTIHYATNQETTKGGLSSMYQDGLLHGLDVIMVGEMFGKRLCDYDDDLRTAFRELERHAKKRDGIEVAYWSGRVEVLERFLGGRRSQIPAYFSPRTCAPTVN